MGGLYHAFINCTCPHLYRDRFSSDLDCGDSITADSWFACGDSYTGLGNRNFDLPCCIIECTSAGRVKDWDDMAEPSGNGPKLAIKTAFGELAATGTTVFIVIALGAMIAMGIWEHYKRRQEHEAIECAINLNLFLQTKQRGEFSWQEIPTEYWKCLPASFANKMKP